MKSVSCTEATNDLKQIKDFQKRGHTYHCACRQVWGDGECECDLYKKGYNPYKWLKLEKGRKCSWNVNTNP